MKWLLLAAASLLPSTAWSGDAAWTPIFNGRDLNGWIPKVLGYQPGENHENVFRAEKGVLKVDYSGQKAWANQFGHLFYSRKLSHYRLRLDYCFTGQQVAGAPGWAFRNSGLMIHCEAPDTMEVNQDFPTGLEVQLLGGTGRGERSTGNLCTPGTHVELNGEIETRHCISSSSGTFHGDQWVTLEVEVRGGAIIRHFINGTEVLAYSRPQLGGNEHAAALAVHNGGLLLESGFICLQAKGHPVEFRKIELMELAP